MDTLLSQFKPKRATDNVKLDNSINVCDNCSQIVLLPNIDNLAQFALLDEDTQLWYNESTLYQYAKFVKDRIKCWQDLNKGKSIKNVKQFTEIVIPLESNLTERNILHLRSFCLKEWKDYDATIQN